MSHVFRSVCQAWIAFAVGISVLHIPSAISQERPGAGGQENALADRPAKTVESSNGEAAPKQDGKRESKPKAPEFVRVLEENKKMQSLQTAVVTYRKPGDEAGVEVTLVGAVHIAQPDYYSRLNQLFHEYDALLYELVADPDAGVPDPEERGVSPISTIQVGMKEALELTFQLDEIDYKAKNFVHADMTPEEFFTTMEKRKEEYCKCFFDRWGLAWQLRTQARVATLICLRPWWPRIGDAQCAAFAQQMGAMDGQMAALTGEDGKSTLITERNAKAFQVLDREVEAGKKKLGIFYGAGHLKDMHQRLVEDYGMEIVKTEWLDAWDLR
ncbi:MAG: hypothetical protein R3C53_02860 [Pirellulaceae bacterium]